MNSIEVARSHANVLVTATEADDRLAWARRIHDSGDARAGRFVCVFPAKKHRLCVDDVDEWFAQAAGGTLFVDHIGTFSAEAQDRFLRLLTEQSRRARQTATAGPNRRVRVVTGSDRSLSADVAIGTFSDELFYRLNVIHIDLAHRFDAPGNTL